MVLPSKLTTGEHSSFSRHVGTLEDLFNNISEVKGSSNREHTSFFVVVQVQFPPTEANVEKHIARAWQSLGERYPALRAQISAPSKWDSSKQSSISVEPWDEEKFRTSFSTHPNCPNVDELFSTPSPKRTTATCHWLPDPGQVVIRTAHWRCDGYGLVLLADSFLSALADTLQKGSSAPLENNGTKQPLVVPESLENLVRKHLPAPSPEETADVEELVAAWSKGRQSIGFPTRPTASTTTTPNMCQRAAIRLTAEDSAKLIGGCQTLGVSVTSAVNAAVIRTAAQFPQAPGADAYAIFAPANFRGPLIAAGAQECSQPTGNYVSGAPLRIDNAVGKSFGELADELNTIYSQDFTRYERGGGAKALNLLQLTEPYISGIAKMFALNSSPGCPFPKAPVISSFGKMDMLVKPEYGGDSDDATGASKLRVTDFWVSCDCATPMITFNPYSWGGEFTLSSAWEDSYYEREFVIDALERTMAELIEGLETGPLSYRITTG
ncbi:Cytochrome p450 protein [Rutstroemia sp. NJR-2017a WRK4]|nr:Cytochrome p450 protein [Rutstroemia sp. NJR-2017a WRK4]